jgi:predicted RNA-binding protein with PUA-like domain
MVDVEFVAAFPELVPLEALRKEPGLDGLLVIRKGQRLSIQPVEAKHFRKIVKMGGGKGGRV